MTPTDSAAYAPRRQSASRFLNARGLIHHVLEWGSGVEHTPALLMLHGWMDVAASFQFVVDALAQDRRVLAPDWRGFGLSESVPGVDSYWFADYLGDLDALLDALLPGKPIDLLGHSMGANVAMIYAGVRPERVRRLVNLEGFGMPATKPEQAAKRYAQWLDELRQPMQLRTYASLDNVAERLRQSNPQLAAQRAAWLAPRWSRQRSDGRFEILGDPAHKRINPILYRTEEVLECWKRITAPVMWVEGERTDVSSWWGNRYTRAEFDQRLSVVSRVERHTLADAGHMLHHDQPERLATLLERFLDS